MRIGSNDQIATGDVTPLWNELMTDTLSHIVEKDSLICSKLPHQSVKIRNTFQRTGGIVIDNQGHLLRIEDPLSLHLFKGTDGQRSSTILSH